MSDADSHARRNQEQMRVISRELIGIHSTLVLRTVDEDLSAALLDDDQAQTLEDAFDEIEDVADDVNCSTRTSGSVSGVLGVSDDG